MENYCFLYSFCSQETSYYAVCKQKWTICVMVIPSLATLMFASFQQGGKFKMQLKTLKEMRDRTYREDGRRANKKTQDKAGNSVPIVCELFA